MKGGQLFVCVSENSLSIKAVVKGISFSGCVLALSRVGSGGHWSGKGRDPVRGKKYLYPLSGHKVRNIKNKPINRCLTSWLQSP